MMALQAAGNEWKQPAISIDLWVQKDEPIAHGFEHVTRVNTMALNGDGYIGWTLNDS